MNIYMFYNAFTFPSYGGSKLTVDFSTNPHAWLSPLAASSPSGIGCFQIWPLQLVCKVSLFQLMYHRIHQLCCKTRGKV